MKYFLSLGSNLGDRRRNLRRAADLLERRGVRVLGASSLYETEPVGHKDQPWFVNQVTLVESELAPLEFLKLLQAIEQLMGRTRSFPGSPRVIDLDILLAEGMLLRAHDLVLPHPRLQERKFVLVPLAELAPDACHPILGKSVRELLETSRDRSVVRVLRKMKVQGTRREPRSPRRDLKSKLRDAKASG